MSSVWVVSANSSRATLYTAKSPIAPLELQFQLNHPEARMKSSELVSDRAGRTFDSQGQGRHAMEQRVDPHEHERELFAREVAQQLESLRSRHAIDELVLVAAPAFLGELRAALSDPLKALISKEISKDYTGLDATQLRSRLP